MASTRRTFLAQSAGATALGATLVARRAAAAGAAADRVTMGCIGCGGQGSSLARRFAAQDRVDVAYVCDPDLDRAHSTADALSQSTGRTPQVVEDLRRVLDDKSVDAVTVATPDHWHAPAALLACAAGKHVYVEKPVSHNIREGRLLVEAARRHNRVVQVGTQSRSAEHVIEAMRLLAEGAIGRVLVAKAWNSQLRRDIGHGEPSSPPERFNYDLWLGPAPEVPFQANRHHYGWHWFYAFGTGDIGNDGVHEIDIARWGLGVECHPETVVSSGAKLFFRDDQQFPDTHYVVCSYPANGDQPAQQLVYEQRLWSNYVQEGFENGNAFYGTDGILLLGKAIGWQLFGLKNEPRQKMAATEMGPPHYRDFLDAIAEPRRTHADVEIGHLSASLCHLGNIAARVGRTLHFDAAAEHVVDDAEADSLVHRSYRDGHWAVPSGV